MITRNNLSVKIVYKCSYCTKSSKPKNVYSSTVILPKTMFPLRLESKKLVERDKRIYTSAKFDHLYTWQKTALKGPEFVLHDGPPYANGRPHMGHAINKVLKDTILRYKILNGTKVNFVPGWDCHGLPIEIKALSNLENTEDPLIIRNKARNFATNTISQQRDTFKSWGLVADWENSYTTYSVDYIKSQFRVFLKLYEKGLIYRDFKPIFWSPSSRTALAEAELEYNEQHKSPSVYVRFEIKEIPSVPIFNSKRVYAVIWTTTPWTLPSNQAICYNNTLSYCVLKKPDPNDFDLYIVATDLFEEFSKATHCNFQLLGIHSGDMLANATYIHPVYKEKICNFYPSQHATASKGTGLVHTAPAHGPDDFLVALRNKISIQNLVNEQGCYTKEAGDIFCGKYVLNEGNETVLKFIEKDILHLGEISHSYPYDWRTKQPVIIRASQQWFIDTEHIKKRAVELLQDVKVIPNERSEIYTKNLISQIEKRPYWCISRQRKWGAPIPVFYDNATKEIILNRDLIQHLTNLLDKHGTDFWWKLTLKDLIPQSWESKLSNIEKGQDILDIWFDSGISWYHVLEPPKIADMYLEGVDQFTGWFQSSLITSVALRDQSPYKTIYVHGYAVDKNGVKMSKSLGNVVDPVEVTNGGKNDKNKAYGVDTLRWWVACHASQDAIAHVSDNVLQSSADEVQKIRSVLRFTLASLTDYQKSENDSEGLLLIDRYMLHLLYQFKEKLQNYISEYQFNKISPLVISFLTNTISALYYTSIKDRLYCNFINSSERRAAQFVLLKIFDTVAQSVAGIVPHLVEEIYEHLPQKDSGETFFTSNRMELEARWESRDIEQIMSVVLSIKKHVNKILGADTLGYNVKIEFSEKEVSLLQNFMPIENYETQLCDVLQVSSVQINKNPANESFEVFLEKSQKSPCPRCRLFYSKMEFDLCKRCKKVLDMNLAYENKKASFN